MIQIQNETDYIRIVEEFSDILFRIAFQNLMNRSDAEDVVQDVFVKLLKQKKGFTDDEHLKAWLIRVTINRCRDYGRLLFRQTEVPLMEYDGIEDTPDREILLELQQLKRAERTVLYLHDYEGYSIREIAELTGRNKNTVGSTLTRARNKMKVLLKEEEAYANLS